MKKSAGSVPSLESAGGNAAIRVAHLKKRFGDVTAVSDISLDVRKGELFGLIGADGAGKTTLMRILCGLMRPDAGTFSVAGSDGLREMNRIKSLIGYMPQKFSLYPDLTVAENLRFFADLFGVTGRERAAREKTLMEFSRLAPFRKRRAAALSGGMKQKLALCCALIHTPDVLILDEPTTGVDPLSRREFWKILYGLSRDDGVTILVSTPYMDEASQCDRIMFMHAGKALRMGAPDELAAAYPWDIVVAAGRQALALRDRIAALPGVVSLYALGERLRISVERGADIRQALEELFAATPAAPPAVSEGKPILEDIFAQLLERGNGDG